MTDNLFLSYELMHLMHWLLKNERSKLKSLIKQAIENGLGEQIDNLHKLEQPSENLDVSLQNSFLDFLYYLEQELMELLEHQDRRDSIQNDLVTSMNKLNVKNIDFDTVWTSIKQAKKDLSKTNIQDKPDNIDLAKKVLLEKVLKNWKPGKLEPIN